MKELLEAYGWISVESKNKFMNSYKKEDMRLNYYFTTGTVTIQWKDERGDLIVKKVDSDEKLEDIIMNL